MGNVLKHYYAFDQNKMIKTKHYLFKQRINYWRIKVKYLQKISSQNYGLLQFLLQFLYRDPMYAFLLQCSSKR